MHDLEMKLHAVIAARFIGDRGEGRVFRGGDDAKAFRQLRHAVAMAHPDGKAAALLPHAVEQRAVLQRRHLGAAEFAMMTAFDLAAELGRHRLLAVADAEHRHAGVENALRRAGRALVRDRARPAGEDHRLGADLGEGALGGLERRDLAIDARLAHAPRDELRHLRAEIDDQHLVVAIGDVVMEGVGRGGHGQT